MKYSAAKSIFKIYKDSGRSLKLSKKRQVLNVINLSEVNPYAFIENQNLPQVRQQISEGPKIAQIANINGHSSDLNDKPSVMAPAWPTL